MNIAICDDLTQDNEHLTKIIHNFFSSNEYSVNIHNFFSGESLLESFEEGKYEIVFLDIFMDGLTGVDVARKIRPIDSSCIIIFTTTSMDYALDGFAVQAMDYLIKPIQQQKIDSVLTRCKNQFSESLSTISVICDKIPVQILIKDICYIEVYLNDCFIHTMNETIKTRTILTDIEKKLSNDKSFLRCHRSYLINMKFVKDIKDNDFIMHDDICIPIPRREKLAIKKAYSDFIFNQIRK